MFYGLNKYIKKILPKRLFYRSLLIVAVPIIGLQLIISIVFFDSLWIKTNKGMTRALVGEIRTFINAYENEEYDKEFKINNTEKKILEKMINSPGEIFTREDIGKLINLDKERSIDVIITRLRKKIEDDPKKPKYLQTIRGTGYVLWIE